MSKAPTIEPDLYARLSARQLARRFRIPEDELKAALRDGACQRYTSGHRATGEVFYSCIAYVRVWMQKEYAEETKPIEEPPQIFPGTYREALRAGIIPS